MNDIHFINIDMDGVTVALAQHVFKVTGINMDSLHDEQARRLFWEDTFDPKWFRDAPPTEDAFVLIDFCKNNFRHLRFLTAIPHSTHTSLIPASMTNKILMVQENFGIKIPVTFGPFSQDKHLHCHGPRSVLIDDMENNILDWGKKGGIAIHHTSAESSIEQLKKLL